MLSSSPLLDKHVTVWSTTPACTVGRDAVEPKCNVWPVCGSLRSVALSNGDPGRLRLFVDIGNLWVDPKYPFDRGAFPMRAAVGSGLRFQTPVGPLAFDIGFNLGKLLYTLGAGVRNREYEDLLALNFAIGLF